MTSKLLRPFYSVLIVLMLVACSRAPVINASDQAMYEHSVQHLMSTLEPERQKAFANALHAILFADVETLGELLAKDEEAMRAKFYERVHGKTPDQVIELAVKLRGQKTPPPQ